MLAPYQGPGERRPVVPLQIAFKNADTGAVFYGAAPVDFDALWAPDGAMDRGAFIANWKAIDDSLETSSTVPDLPTGASIEAASAKLSARNAHYVARRAVPNQPAGTESSYKITLLPGDGIGPEITAATVKALNAAGATKGVSFEYDEQLLGGCAIDAAGTPWPEATLKSCQAADSILMAAIGGPKWDGNPRELRPETGLLAMRQELGLFANLRPAKAIPQLLEASSLKPEIVEGVDIMVVRELCGDVYFGKPAGIFVNDEGHRVGQNNMIYSEPEIERIARVAMDVAAKRGGKCCSIDKANVLDVSQLWKEVVIRVHGEQWADSVELSHMYVDNAAMQLVRWPKQFDTIVCGNIFGDILSDEASMLPIHGSAPDIAAPAANPLAMILSAAMMCTYDLAQPELGQLLEDAVEAVLDDGLRTKDIVSEGATDQTLVGCVAMGDAVAAKVEALAKSRVVVVRQNDLTCAIYAGAAKVRVSSSG
ncbi:3-isopropylmalate dehydrogenase [Aureococcus anophagefferens]|nr:3-isopropylmalate dehydrogenase [Aureococcus anophagefferens]